MAEIFLRKEQRGMSVIIGTYQDRPVRIIESCLPNIEQQIRKNEYKTKDNITYSTNSFDICAKKRKNNIHLGDFSESHLYRSKYRQSELITDESNKYSMSSNYDRYWFNQRG